MSPFLVWLSGDDPAQERQAASGVPGQHTGFVAISPFVPATNLFFGGGISEAYSDRRAAAAGVNSRGVVAPGVEVRCNSVAEMAEKVLRRPGVAPPAAEGGCSTSSRGSTILGRSLVMELVARTLIGLMIGLLSALTATALAQLQTAPNRPAFDCSKAGGEVRLDLHGREAR